MIWSQENINQLIRRCCKIAGIQVNPSGIDAPKKTVRVINALVAICAEESWAVTKDIQTDLVELLEAIEAKRNKVPHAVRELADRLHDKITKPPPHLVPGNIKESAAQESPTDPQRIT